MGTVAAAAAAVVHVLLSWRDDRVTSPAQCPVSHPTPRLAVLSEYDDKIASVIVTASITAGCRSDSLALNSAASSAQRRQRSEARHRVLGLYVVVTAAHVPRFLVFSERSATMSFFHPVCLTSQQQRANVFRLACSARR